jgi:hypothetical protein
MTAQSGEKRQTHYNKSANLYGNPKTVVSNFHGEMPRGGIKSPTGITAVELSKKKSIGVHATDPLSTHQKFELDTGHDDKLSTFLEIHERKKLRLFQAPTKFGLKFKNKSEEERYLRLCSKIIRLS